MATWDEQVRLAKLCRWKVVSKEFYNPGGTTYRDVLVDAEGNEHGFVDKYVQSQQFGRNAWFLVPDPDAAAWDALSGCE